MTNGEKLVETFPSIGLYKKAHDGIQINFNSVWFNAEYKEPTTKNDLEVDCISRQAVLEQAEAFGNGTEPYGYYVNVEDIQALPSVTPQSRWIPVSERLPEENRTVIASAEYGFYPEARYTKEDGWEWAYESGADYWVEIESDVLAWMPLPEPYREVEE